MVQDAEDGCGPVLSRAHDPRVTPLGRRLRALRLDELPQLLNVLRGDMGLVGPRPERPEFVDQFQQMLPDYHLRRLMPPGIMGLAQLAGHYGTLPQDKLRYDLFYIRNWSLWLDIRIILQTLRFVAAGGAEHGLPSSGEVPGDLEKFLRAAGVLADTARS
jgi:lipopolysaccharide/colanic/teichoic acid biosynthesis glycosyltransferase